MFTDMISALKNNSFPDLTSLRGKLNIGLIKKEAVLRLPKNFRVSDPKINPRSDHMIWASVLLEDRDLFDLTTAIFLTDLSMNQDIEEHGKRANDDIIKATLVQLLKTSQDPSVRRRIHQSIKKITHLLLPPLP